MSKVKAFSKPHTPLTPAIFYILLALAQKERHGYEIMKQVRIDSDNKVKLGPGTLYGAIKRMLEDRLIVELDSSNAERRRYYKLTEKGESIFTSELQRYEQALIVAKKNRLFATPSVVKLTFSYVQ